MATKTLEYLRGISPDDCARLRQRGIRHSNQLLHAVTLEIDRQRLAARTGISEDRLFEFGNQCAMLEISGMDRLVPVLRRLGIHSLTELKAGDAGELHRRLAEALGLAGAPSLAAVQYWISQARLCDCMEAPTPRRATGMPAIR